MNKRWIGLAVVTVLGTDCVSKVIESPGAAVTCSTRQCINQACPGPVALVRDELLQAGRRVAKTGGAIQLLEGGGGQGFRTLRGRNLGPQYDYDQRET